MESAEQKALVESLRRVGLGRYEAAVYLGLLMDETARVSEISKRTGVPQPKTYQALDTLVDKGFCTLGSESVNRYRAVRPEDAFKNQLSFLRTEQEGVTALAGELERIRQAGIGQELWAPPIEVIKGLAQVERFVLKRIALAKHEILFFGKVPHMPAVDIADALRDHVGRGGGLRILFERAFLDQEGAGDEAGKYHGLNGEYRVVEALPTKMIIIDEQVAVSSIAHSGKNLDLVLRQKGLVDHFVASFELHWARGKPPG